MEKIEKTYHIKAAQLTIIALTITGGVSCGMWHFRHDVADWLVSDAAQTLILALGVSVLVLFAVGLIYSLAYIWAVTAARRDADRAPGSTDCLGTGIKINSVWRGR